jgi:hypothetical protein
MRTPTTIVELGRNYKSLSEATRAAACHLRDTRSPGPLTLLTTRIVRTVHLDRGAYYIDGGGIRHNYTIR